MSGQPPDPVRLLRDMLARSTRLGEFVQDGEVGEALVALDDLVDDLWKLLDALLKAA